MLVPQANGNFRFLPIHQPIAVPFSSAVVADDGFEIVHVVLGRPTPYRAGFELIERYLAGLRRPRQALCGVELRCTEPYSVQAFQAFNARYAELLAEWGLFRGGVGAATRTNIAPSRNPPSEQVLYGFSYTAPSAGSPPTWVLSGAFEDPATRPGETSPDALRAKTADVIGTLTQRLEAAGLSWDSATDIGLYTVHDLFAALSEEMLPRIAPAVLHGIRWYPSLVPVAGFELEIDVRNVRQELRIAST